MPERHEAPRRAPTDRELLDRFVRGRDHQALACILVKHGRMIEAVAGRILNDIDLAKDAAQAVALVFVRKAHTIRSASLATWLHRVALNVALTERQKRIVRRLREEEAGTMQREHAARAAIEDEDRLRIRGALDEALGRLPRKLRQAVILRFLEGMSPGEAAAELECNGSTLSMRVNRALDQLRRHLGRKGIAVTPAALAVVLAGEAIAGAPGTAPAAAGLAEAAQDPGASLSSPAARLADEALRAMSRAKILGLAGAGGAAAVAIAGWFLLSPDRRPAPDGPPAPVSAQARSNVPAAGPPALPIRVASLLGGDGDADRVVGAKFARDGSILLAAHLSPGFASGTPHGPIPGARSDAAGHLIRLSPDGRALLAVKPVAEEIRDMDVDGRGNVYLAAGPEGVIVIDARLDGVLWRVADRPIDRIAASPDGRCAALGARDVLLRSPDGAPLATIPCPENTRDLCLDGASDTVVVCGFHIGRDRKSGLPAHVPFLRGYGLDGALKWRDYDWSTDPASPRYLNRHDRNLADTHPCRCSIGGDGKLYVAFEVAGGNHILRYDPQDLAAKAPLVGGGAHHEFHGSRSEHKLVFGRYEPTTGKLLLAQQFCARLENGQANAVLVRQGDIAADGRGRVAIACYAGQHVPATYNPLPAGAYQGGACLLVMAPDFSRILSCSVLGPGIAHAVDAADDGETLRIIWGGGGSGRTIDAADKSLPPLAFQFPALNPFQRDVRGNADGFVVLLAGESGRE
jgi:RNA polymerase sigma factor (sigma-70 family)